MKLNFPFSSMFSKLRLFWGDPHRAWTSNELITQTSQEAKNEVLYPMLVLCFFAVAFGTYIDKQEIVASLIWGLVKVGILFASYYVCTIICKKERAIRNQIIDDETCNKFILYPFTIVIGVTMAHSLLTSWFFLYLLLLFVVYEVWIASTTFFRINDKTRDSFFLVNSLSIIIVPIILESVIKKILVNL